MFVIPDSKVVILFTPRTGSSTLHRLLNRFCGDRLATPYVPIHLHKPFWQLQQDVGENLEDYRMFAFGRHPVSWFDSCVKYNWNKHLDTIEEYHKNISPRRHFEIGRFGLQSHILASRDWLDRGDDNVVFNFHDFTNEVIRLFSYLDVELTPEDVEKNSNHITWSGWNREYTEREIEQIKYWYWVDYHYLEFMGWECDNSLNTLIKGSNFDEFRKTDHYLQKSLAPLDAVE
jgi:hypothetical protein